MPEVKDARPVSGLIYPSKNFLKQAVAAGEVKAMLGVGPGQARCSNCGRGVVVRKPLPGHVNAVEGFFDWQESKASKFGALLGKLKTQEQVKKVVGANHPCRAQILKDVADYREAVSK